MTAAGRRPARWRRRRPRRADRGPVDGRASGSGGVPRRARACRWTPRATGARHRGRMARGVRRDAHARAPFEPDDVPQRRGVRRAGARPVDPGAVALRAPHAAVRRGRARRLPARRADPRAVEAGSGGRDVRPTPAGAGAADQAGRRLAADPPRAARGRRRRRGRAPLHDACAASGRPAPAPSPRRCTGCCATTPARGRSSSRSPQRLVRRVGTDSQTLASRCRPGSRTREPDGSGAHRRRTPG